ncbi:MAG: hypothetical protein UU40_C0006G0022 [Candidatus Uhrbacteria bacterium GW2011_GWD2_41_121]|uniref:Uncharacterized protein n=1 Tax=Candidatus Uhrbacteria bacterium GW2011_GWC1_41_20 TaxID=1618983 RepID=A0A0G0VHZ8_9BACT|nr:MAG: hypothetical protein UT52_C0009G0022 [Candidatus Uhrbacteria bacterium GW2011_GWE1_39_46]KKR63979.1 MAG: hypothetical protein UU04_C0008G0022 [Candidatus Uhrbacteria bacterium GW2011_GWC2_40_450]KKR90238.1 MAG: hypothetical protein UU40_C0006G0022 [Candidatus Uhrbacteria bacterium GW2011_GWD2_41_121]KKR95619.1 MAG: hypothetical protein UU46_C0018G0008 [Candidatus Uhrbacteria bacterium GW2011_GWD1_41_16]KKR99266.1 MAG: hypothetical protein UU50_C0008G0022 [Candidatus Uhrbacteria bacteriu
MTSILINDVKTTCGKMHQCGLAQSAKLFHPGLKQLSYSSLAV